MAEPSGSFETAGSFAGQGLAAGTRVATAIGWRAVETIQAGDAVLTFDNGMQTVRDVRRITFRSDPAQHGAHMQPVLVPVGALGNRVPMILLPEQGVLVESDAASDAMGDPFALVPAHTLAGYRGIHADHQPREITVITICFEKPQVIYAESGTLVYCPQAHLDLLDMVKPDYSIMSTKDAKFLVECMQYEDLTGPTGLGLAA